MCRLSLSCRTRHTEQKGQNLRNEIFIRPFNINFYTVIIVTWHRLNLEERTYSPWPTFFFRREKSTLLVFVSKSLSIDPSFYYFPLQHGEDLLWYREVDPRFPFCSKPYRHKDISKWVRLNPPLTIFYIIPSLFCLKI